jgi:hypothetical protein
MAIINLWIDDEREMPHAFTHWTKTSQEAIDFLSKLDPADELGLVGFDHDLALSWEDGHPSLDNNEKPDTSIRVAEYMVSQGIFPELVVIHSMNPVGAGNLKRIFDSANVNNMIAPYNPRNYA